MAKRPDDPNVYDGLDGPGANIDLSSERPGELPQQAAQTDVSAAAEAIEGAKAQLGALETDLGKLDNELNNANNNISESKDAQGVSDEFREGLGNAEATIAETIERNDKLVDGAAQDLQSLEEIQTLLQPSDELKKLNPDSQQFVQDAVKFDARSDKEKRQKAEKASQELNGLGLNVSADALSSPDGADKLAEQVEKRAAELDKLMEERLNRRVEAEIAGGTTKEAGKETRLAELRGEAKRAQEQLQQKFDEEAKRRAEAERREFRPLTAAEQQDLINKDDTLRDLSAASRGADVQGLKDSDNIDELNKVAQEGVEANSIMSMKDGLAIAGKAGLAAVANAACPGAGLAVSGAIMAVSAIANTEAWKENGDLVGAVKEVADNIGNTLSAIKDSIGNALEGAKDIVQGIATLDSDKIQEGAGKVAKFGSEVKEVASNVLTAKTAMAIGISMVVGATVGGFATDAFATPPDLATSTGTTAPAAGATADLATSTPANISQVGGVYDSDTMRCYPADAAPAPEGTVTVLAPPSESVSVSPEQVEAALNADTTIEYDSASEVVDSAVNDATKTIDMAAEQGLGIESSGIGAPALADAMDKLTAEQLQEMGFTADQATELKAMDAPDRVAEIAKIDAETQLNIAENKEAILEAYGDQIKDTLEAKGVEPTADNIETVMEKGYAKLYNDLAAEKAATAEPAAQANAPGGTAQAAPDSANPDSAIPPRTDGPAPSFEETLNSWESNLSGEEFYEQVKDALDGKDVPAFENMDKNELAQLASQVKAAMEQDADVEVYVNQMNGAVFANTVEGNALEEISGIMPEEPDLSNVPRVDDFNDKADAIVVKGGTYQNTLPDNMRSAYLESYYNDVQEGDLVVQDGHLVVQDGHLVVQDGDLVVQDGDLVVQDGDLVVVDTDKGTSVAVRPDGFVVNPADTPNIPTGQEWQASYDVAPPRDGLATGDVARELRQITGDFSNLDEAAVERAVEVAQNLKGQGVDVTISVDASTGQVAVTDKAGNIIMETAPAGDAQIPEQFVEQGVVKFKPGITEAELDDLLEDNPKALEAAKKALEDAEMRDGDQTIQLNMVDDPNAIVWNGSDIVAKYNGEGKLIGGDLPPQAAKPTIPDDLLEKAVEAARIADIGDIQEEASSQASPTPAERGALETGRSGRNA